MKPIHSLEQLQALFKQYPRAVTNCFLLPAELRERIARGLLTYDDANGALFLYEQHERYRKLLYRVTNFTAAALPARDMPLVTFTVYKGEPNAQESEWLLSQGFRLEHTRHFLTAEAVRAEVRHEITPATEDEALALFDATFSPYVMDLPMRGHFQNLAAVRDGNGEPLGIVYYETALSPQVIAVKPEARGQGVGSSLLGYVASVAPEGLFRYCVVDYNETAYGLYRKLGFSPSGVRSDVFILE